MDIRVKGKTLQLLEENLGEYPFDLDYQLLENIQNDKTDEGKKMSLTA